MTGAAVGMEYCMLAGYGAIVVGAAPIIVGAG
eukprot:CAMPEP_0185909698 /NCGR_PEP_ID=MMETSP0196C-20130402/14600_1 /TAXON_ID=2932 /ORGANISM="Alexandrium fundyense, Strain CCMP1719" /LENGTH=31 /DNA_ID= /DNA_START= /DNA_END= /DNA_ORIENTATION=